MINISSTEEERAFNANVQCWIWSKSFVGIRKKAVSEKNLLFVMSLDTDLFNLDLQMLIDHDVSQSVQMLGP